MRSSFIKTLGRILGSTCLSYKMLRGHKWPKKTHNCKGELRRGLGFPQLDFYFIFLILTDSCKLALPNYSICIYMHVYVYIFSYLSDKRSQNLPHDTFPVVLNIPLHKLLFAGVQVALQN